MAFGAETNYNSLPIFLSYFNEELAGKLILSFKNLWTFKHYKNKLRVH